MRGGGIGPGGGGVATSILVSDYTVRDHVVKSHKIMGAQ